MKTDNGCDGEPSHIDKNYAGSRFRARRIHFSRPASLGDLQLRKYIRCSAVGSTIVGAEPRPVILPTQVTAPLSRRWLVRRKMSHGTPSRQLAFRSEEAVGRPTLAWAGAFGRWEPPLFDPSRFNSGNRENIRCFAYCRLASVLVQRRSCPPTEVVKARVAADYPARGGQCDGISAQACEPDWQTGRVRSRGARPIACGPGTCRCAQWQCGLQAKCAHTAASNAACAAIFQSRYRIPPI